MKTPLFVCALALLVINTPAATPPSPDPLIVDFVNSGDEASERDHQLKSEASTTQEFLDRKIRIAETNGWYSWELKVQADVPQELNVDFGGVTGRRGTTNFVEIFVADTRVGRVRLAGGARREYYPLNADLLKGKSTITVRVQNNGAGSNGISSVFTRKIPAPTIASASQASSTRTNWQQIARAVNDQREPVVSADRYKPHFDWWPAHGTNQWLQYDFAKPARVSAVAVFWYDDTGRGGGCTLPKSWQILYHENGEWKPVAHPSAGGCAPDIYNRATFDAVETDGLRLDAVMPDRYSAGVLQWRVE